MKSFIQRSLTLAFLMTVTLAVAAPAIAQRGDVWLFTDGPNTKIGLGVVDEAGTTLIPGVRTLQAILVPDTLPFSSFDYSAEEPGFRASAGDLPAAQSIALTPIALSLWTDTGLVRAVGVAFDFDLPGGLSSDSHGALHEHPLFGLTASGSSLPDGVYVADFTASTAGLDDSDLYRFVMLKDDRITNETDAGALIGSMEDYENGGSAPVFGGKDFTFFEDATTMATVPEPTAIVLAGWGLLLLSTYRRR